MFPFINDFTFFYFEVHVAKKCGSQFEFNDLYPLLYFFTACNALDTIVYKTSTMHFYIVWVYAIIANYLIRYLKRLCNSISTN